MTSPDVNSHPVKSNQSEDSNLQLNFTLDFTNFASFLGALLWRRHRAPAEPERLTACEPKHCKTSFYIHFPFIIHAFAVKPAGSYIHNENCSVHTHTHPKAILLFSAKSVLLASQKRQVICCDLTLFVQNLRASAMAQIYSSWKTYLHTHIPIQI